MQAESLVGTTLGQYQIVEELGRGGMAIVYKAWQPSLRRYVAIKVMLPHLLNDQEFMRRFQQEAIVAANLNHPNVVTIYEVEQQDDHLYIVMEYVEGKSLEEVVISEGPLHLERVTKILEQVADALDYAHRRQFVHRDIKPSNILVTPEGRAVISDFGIAKALRGSGATARLTATGTILGSPAYMSPEQIIGEDVDYRTDLYSLGIVAYEMLSGRAPFGGSTTALLYAQVNTTPPSIAALNPSLPPQVENALVRMLAKQPSQRFPNASAFVKALEGQSLPAQAPKGRTEVMPPSAATPYPQPQPQSQPQTVPYGGYGYGAEPQTQQAGSWPQAGQNASQQANGSYYPASQPTAAPKKKRGSLLIWILAGGGLLAMIVLTIVALFLLEIGPFAGEEVVEETPVVPVINDRIAFVSEREGLPQIYVMNGDGSDLRRLVTSESSDYYPRWSPNVERISNHSYPPGIAAGEGDAQLFLIDVGTGDRSFLETTVANAKFATWSSDGEALVFSGERDGDWDLYVYRLDTESIRRLTQGASKDYFADWSPDGDKIAFTRVLESGDREIFVVTPDGLDLTNLTNNPEWDSHPSWSPDSQRIAFESRRTGNSEIFLMNADGSGVTQLTDTPGFNNTEPRFGPDGDRIVFVSDRDGNSEIYTMGLDGQDIVRLTYDEQLDYNPHWR